MAPWGFRATLSTECVGAYDSILPPVGKEIQLGSDLWNLERGDGRLVATAIHDGHHVRAEVEPLLAISDADRLREEDPFTGLWTDIADTRIVGVMSRFEMDLNRPRGGAVYIEPEDAWGLHVWKSEPSTDLVARSLQQYDEFYSMVEEFFSELERRFGRFVVLDLHTYNHRRSGPNGPLADAEENPEINIGTGSMDRERWAPLVDRFIRDLSSHDIGGRSLDVRENIKFRGGNFSRWIHERFPRSGCALAIEVKKFFMDEWSGELDPELHNSVHRALQSTVTGLRQELAKLAAPS